MTPYCLDLAAILPEHAPLVGGKALSLAHMTHRGIPVPPALAVTTAAYHEYVAATGLAERILLELHRKDFRHLRWEELWDAALRLRHLFLATPLPPALHQALEAALVARFPHQPVVVRSSAPGEDSRQASFAGLHESYVNVTGPAAIVDHIRLVWASLWSDAALLYRQELGLDVATSSMAVLVQALVAGQRSGVAFSRAPQDDSLAVIEAVHGLNQGLVDGAIDPDRWTVARRDRRLVAHTPASSRRAMVPAPQGARLADLPPDVAQQPPLSEPEVLQVYDLTLQAETFAAAPQDVEWTIAADHLWLLQSRPITTLAAPDPHAADVRPWYLSLRRSLANLQELRRRIETELLPALAAEAASLARQDLTRLDAVALAAALQHRAGRQEYWTKVYWDDFIPFAHGMRLFGQIYNDALRPADPYEFVELLGAAPLASLARNQALAELAARLHRRPEMAPQLAAGHLDALDPDFRHALDDFLAQYGDLSCPVTGAAGCAAGYTTLAHILAELASHAAPPQPAPPLDLADRTAAFFARFPASERPHAEALLDLARASYRLRDDDNIYLGRLEAQLLSALQEARRRLAARGLVATGHLDAATLARCLTDPGYVPPSSPAAAEPPAPPRFTLKPRQLTGQPAGPGLARGRARIVTGPHDLKDFRRGDILVCDAIDPNMTFIVPLAAAVVERRGGMLIHGAIIAREYGLPCVTGVPDATRLIHTGDLLTVDGYLGIVTVGETSAPPS